MVIFPTSSSSLYELRVLRDHGFTATSLQDVSRATVIAKIMHCAPAWSGLCSACDQDQLDAFLRRMDIVLSTSRRAETVQTFATDNE